MGVIENNLNPKSLEEAKAIIAALVRQNRELEERNGRLEERISKLEERIRELEGLLNKNSSNSSKPPSSDPPWVKRKPPEQPSGRKPGGQPGHEGKARQLLPAEKVTKFVPLIPERCSKCGSSIEVEKAGVRQDATIHQVIEFPEVKPEVTQYDLWSCKCNRCGATTRAQLPAGVSQSPFGPRLHAVVALMGSKYKMSRRDVVNFCEDLLGIKISVGAVQGVCESVSEAVACVVEEVAAEVAEAATVHVDETGWRQNGEKCWLWAVTTDDAELFRIMDGRGRVELERLLPEDFEVIVHSDRLRVYEMFDELSRQLCHGHLRRDFQGLIDRGGKGVVIGEGFLRSSNRMFRLWHAFKAGEFDRKDLIGRMQPVQSVWERNISEAMNNSDRKACALGKELMRNFNALWTFIYEEGVEPTNNDVEQALRKAVILRKCSFGTQSDAGSRFVDRMMTVIGTAKRRKLNLLEWLYRACHAAFCGLSPPALAPPAAVMI